MQFEIVKDGVHYSVVAQPRQLPSAGNRAQIVAVVDVTRTRFIGREAIVDRFSDMNGSTLRKKITESHARVIMLRARTELNIVEFENVERQRKQDHLLEVTAR